MEFAAALCAALLLFAARSLQGGDMATAETLLTQAQEANWTNRKALITASAIDSIRVWSAMSDESDEGNAARCNLRGLNNAG